MGHNLGVSVLLLLLVLLLFEPSLCITSEEELIGHKLNVHPITPIFENYLQSREDYVVPVNDYILHHSIVEDFCKSRDKASCNHSEYYACLETLRKPYRKVFDPARLSITPEEILSHWYNKDEDLTCTRLSNPTPEEFMPYVVRSQPVVITGWANHWIALKKWTWLYLRKNLAQERVVVSSKLKSTPINCLNMEQVSPNPYFDGPENANFWINNTTERYIVARPAQMTLTFKEFLLLLKSPYANNETFFYMQYLPLKLYEKGQVKDDTKELNVSFADFLDSRLNLLWLGDGRTKGWIHNDRQENLMAMIAGEKTFRLVPPLTAQTEYLYAGMPMRGGGLIWEFTSEKDELGLPLAKFVRNISKLSAINPYQAYTAVRLDRPNYDEFPKSRNLKYMKCVVKAGEILYTPAHWWHEVDSGPDQEGKNLGINWFFEPLYNHIFTNDTVWEPNRHYYHLAEKLEKAVANSQQPLSFDLKELLRGRINVQGPHDEL